MLLQTETKKPQAQDALVPVAEEDNMFQPGHYPHHPTAADYALAGAHPYEGYVQPPVHDAYEPNYPRQAMNATINGAINGLSDGFEPILPGSIRSGYHSSNMGPNMRDLMPPPQPRYEEEELPAIPLDLCYALQGNACMMMPPVSPEINLLACTPPIPSSLSL